MQTFYINKNSVLPKLRMCLAYDGRYEFMKSSHFYAAIQKADVTFSMWDDHDVLKISDAQCNIVLTDQDSCDERYIIEYEWKKRDTKIPGQYRGRFTITFKDDIYELGQQYDGGDLIMPIYEDLTIFIKP